ncbi:hypothetical protein AVEN_78689-1 [Araneus ventricosus]|uniref:Uncharacterized protein n=1 Tax=Araneus ventricosus TaxID=182803 RepID=A0A4Y2JB62_ARAVE|nr:hypothetical protein AVEN_78689-1 [Araneus ventricosus]
MLKQNRASTDQTTYVAAPSCIKMVKVRKCLCCSCGTTNVFSMSLCQRASTGPLAAIFSKKNGPLMNVAMHPHQEVTLENVGEFHCPSMDLPSPKCGNSVYSLK